MGKAVFKISGRAAGPVARRATTAPGRIRRTMTAEFKGDLAAEVTGIFQDEAPKGETGELAASIDTSVSFGGGGVNLTVKADPISERGFHYLDVTRFGRGAMVPKSGRAIFWESADHPVAHVGAYRPAGDWVDAADSASARVVSAASGRIGRVLATQVL